MLVLMPVLAGCSGCAGSSAGSPAVSGGSFSDVAADAYYAKAVAWANENGITSGVGSNKFAPNADCTRAQIVTLLYRAQ